MDYDARRGSGQQRSGVGTYAGTLALTASPAGIDVDQNGWADFGEDFGRVINDSAARMDAYFSTYAAQAARDMAIDLAQSPSSDTWQCPPLGSDVTEADADRSCFDSRGIMNFALVPALERYMSEADAIAQANAWTSSLSPESFWCYHVPDDPTSNGWCHWRPMFARTNVLPEGLEFVWYNAGEPPTTDYQIVKILRPFSLCTPVPPEPVVSDPGFLFFPVFRSI